MSLNIRDVPCGPCVEGYSTAHTCDSPDYCPCDHQELHTLAASEPTPRAKPPRKRRKSPTDEAVEVVLTTAVKKSINLFKDGSHIDDVLPVLRRAEAVAQEVLAHA